MYVERKEKERGFLEFRNKRKEIQKRPKWSVQLPAHLTIALTPTLTLTLTLTTLVKGSNGASRKKMKLESSPKESRSEPPKDQRDVFQGQGYRLVDLERFSSTLSEAHVCEEGVKISYNVCSFFLRL